MSFPVAPGFIGSLNDAFGMVGDDRVYNASSPPVNAIFFKSPYAIPDEIYLKSFSKRYLADT